MEAMMAQVLSMNAAREAVHESVRAGLIAGLDIEFGEGAGVALAGRFWDAEACDFFWDARVCERWLGSLDAQDEAGDGSEEEFDRVVIMAPVEGCWVVAVLLIDGDGQPHMLLGERRFDSSVLARQAYGATG